MWKHQVLHHGGAEDAKFHLRPIQFHRSALNRQISEAVRIGRYGEDKVLNSRGEYNRSRIARLSLGGEDYEKKPVLEEDKKANEKSMEEWESEKSKNILKKSQAEWKKNHPLKKTTSKKNKEDDLIEEDKENGRGSSKRRKFERIGEGCWGEVDTRLVTTVGIPQPYLPLNKRVVSRKKIFRGGNIVRNNIFSSTDIRYFCTTRADVSTVKSKPDVGTRSPAFDDKNMVEGVKHDEAREDEEQVQTTSIDGISEEIVKKDDEEV